MRLAALALCSLVPACDRPEPPAPSGSAASSARASSGPRRLLWRQGADHALVLDRPALSRLDDPERAAVVYLATTIGSECEWTDSPGATADGGRGSMRCELTDALGLGPQCEAEHRNFVTSWLGGDAPTRCAKIPTTAFSQTTFEELTLRRDGRRIVIDYRAVHTEGPAGKTHAWSEEIRFAPRDRATLRIEQRRVTHGARPP